MNLSIIGFDMKKIFRKLACCSFLSIASIGCFDAEARVTKEVAEAVLPYLMEAAGIEGDQHSDSTRMANKAEYENNKIQAILDMIYTDEGQQQMVNWVQDGTFPTKLDGAGFKSAETYKDKAYRDASLASLFPCSTGTFTSFANHKSRLGYHILSCDIATKVEYIKRLLTAKSKNEIDNIFSAIKGTPVNSIDAKIAIVVFILDIFDESSTIISCLGQLQPTKQKELAKSLASKHAQHEYSCRPVSAIVAKNDKDQLVGDCVETMYRHLINITIQSGDDPSKLLTGKVNNMNRYLKGSTFTIGGKSYAGNTNIENHIEWKKWLVSTVSNHVKKMFQIQHGEQSIQLLDTEFKPEDFSVDIVPSKIEQLVSHGSERNIATVLACIAGLDFQSINEIQDNCEIIKAALNKIDSSKEFSVKTCTRLTTDPEWANVIIEISLSFTNSQKKIARIGICTKAGQYCGHAEILDIAIIDKR